MGEQEVNELRVSLAELGADVRYIKDNFSTHVREAEKPGGRHDRLLLAEQQIIDLGRQIIDLKKWVLWAGIIGGVIGGLLAKAAPDVFGYIAQIIK